MKRRNTKSTSEVLSILTDSNSALSHEMIQEKVSENIDRATIYRILSRFLEDGVAHEIIGDDGKKYFALCEDCEANHPHQHNHFHFRCLDCGSVECLEEEVNVNLPKGYKSVSFNGLVSGYCLKCG
ncbi:MAG: transcriptional repressor [Saprospiraceae bacterium]|nr:transcriptional repressor [Saprospiraceae bacterium]